MLIKVHLVTQQDYQSRGISLRSHSEQDTIVITQDLNGKQDIGHVISGEV